MPWCLACAILVALFCSSSGSTIRRPLRMMLYLCASDCSARLACRVWNVPLFMPSSTPCHLLARMDWMTVVSVLSFAVSVATSSTVIALGEGLRLRGCSLSKCVLFFSGVVCADGNLSIRSFICSPTKVISIALSYLLSSMLYAVK